MEKFIVSARKYRPNNFVSLVGQESIAVTLKNSIKRGQLAHAYLFCGPRGVGKTSTARIFAKTINCLNPSADLEPCGECESCRSFAEGRSYCIHELDAASNNSVDDIRLLTEKVRIPPQIGKYSVYIIDEVHMLSSAAFNAFLKTLEEPPAHAIFILATTEKHKILPTVLSRCQTYDFNRISVEDIVKNLADIARKEGISIDSDALHVIAQKADGAMRDALTLFDQTVAFCGTKVEYASVIKNLNVLDYDYYFNLTECSLRGDFPRSLLLFDEILSKGFNALYFISGLSGHLRNLLVCKDASTLKLLEMAPSLAEKYREQSGRCSVKFLFDALALTTRCESEYRNSNNQRLLAEFLLIRLASLQQQTAPASGRSAGEPAGVPDNTTGGTVGNMPHTASQPDGMTATPIAPHSTPVQKQPEVPVRDVTEQEEPDNKGGDQKASSGPVSRIQGLSIKKIIKNARENGASSVADETPAANEEITPEKLKAAWIKMGDAETRYPRLGSAIKQTEPQIEADGQTVLFHVSNSAQQIWIEKNSLTRLTRFLQDELGNNTLKLIIKVKDAAQQEKKLYMPHEKAEFLLKNNSELQELKKELDLDIR